MTETYALKAQKREMAKRSARDTRQEHRVPAVVYGHGVDPVPVSLDYSEILKIYRKAGTSSLIDLDLNGKNTKVLIQVMELHPVKNTIHHIDFFAVNLKEKTTVSVPFNFVGESAAVKDHGGVFTKEHDSIDIRCLPTEIPHEIAIDISKIENIHDHITVADLGLDTEKYEIMHLEPEAVICTVAPPKIEVEEEPETAEGEEGEESAEGEEKKEGGEEEAKKEEGAEKKEE